MERRRENKRDSRECIRERAKGESGGVQCSGVSGRGRWVSLEEGSKREGVMRGEIEE